MGALKFLFGSVMILIAVWLAFVPRSGTNEPSRYRSLATQLELNESLQRAATPAAPETPPDQALIGSPSSMPRQQQPIPAENATPVATHVVGVQSLNLRAGASSATRILSSFPAGTHVTLLTEQMNWSEVLAGDLRGWMFTRYLDPL